MNEKLKQRLVGAVVLVSLAVIFIPMLLDGGDRSTMPTFGSNIPDKPDYQFEPLEIPLQPLPSIDESRPVLIDKPEPAPEPEAPPAEEAEPASAPEPAPPKAEQPKAEPKPEPEPEPEPVMTPPEPSPTPVDEGSVSAWVVQVGSFSLSDNALALRDKLRSNGFTAYVEKVKTSGGMIFRVRVGPEIKRENAEKQLKRLERVMELKGLVMPHGG